MPHTKYELADLHDVAKHFKGSWLTRVLHPDNSYHFDGFHFQLVPLSARGDFVEREVLDLDLAPFEDKENPQRKLVHAVEDHVKIGSPQMQTHYRYLQVGNRTYLGRLNLEPKLGIFYKVPRVLEKR